MDNEGFQAFLAQLAETQQKLLNSHKDFMNECTNELKRKRIEERSRDFAEGLLRQLTEEQNRRHTEEQNRRSIPLINSLREEEEFLTWRDKLINVLEIANLHDHVLREVPEPADEVEKEKWKKDRAAVDNYIQMTVPDHAVWTNLKGMGWDITERNPKSTLDKLAQYFNKDTHEANFLLCREMFTIKREDYDKFSTFQHRLNYLRQRLDQTKSWKMTENAATIRALEAIATAHPDVYNRFIAKAHNNELSWAALMVEFRAISTG
ncbi:hypothetical protein F5144DRAFT_51299 [Chaetomium tenue]|uniref:Uncharacterized protein n=1 Tax=Chaetomium tenue TaxID=1854479 RepID=A0ACB7PNA4_9PEZI|nr:hypothetical protein F5144DRAFT_51299 [Chaetomium globosum]